MIPAQSLAGRGSAPHPAGAAPLRPGQNQNKTFLRRKNKGIPAPSRWSGRGTVGQKRNEEKLARGGVGAVKQLHVLGSASLAGFEVFTEGSLKGESGLRRQPSRAHSCENLGLSDAKLNSRQPKTAAFPPVM